MNKQDILIVCALELETVGQLEDYRVLYTGVGKVNATLELTKVLQKAHLHYMPPMPKLVINYGTAVIVDDVLATGGTLQAVNHLAGMAGYDVIDNLVLIDLLYVTRTFTMMVDGAKEFDLEVKSLIQYE